MRKSDIFKTLALGAALAAAWIIPAAGQTPPGLINFQGRLTDSANNPLSGPHDFVFDLYDAPSAGTRLWTEAQSAVPVANGVLAAQLGSVSPVPASVFRAGAVYLQITVDGTPLSPRQRLVSSPYAFNSAALSGRDYTAFVSTDAAAQTVAGDKTFTGVLGAAQLRLASNVTLAQEPSAALGAGVRVSSNVYIVGFSSAAKYYGDGSALTGVSGSDNLGDHTATKDLDLAGHQIVNVSSLTVSGKDAASGYSLYLSSGLYMPAGTVTAAHLAGDGRGVYGVLASSVAAGAINTAGHFADQVMPLSKLAQSGCAGGQIPKWDGAAWACAADNGGTSYTADEAGLHLAGGVFSALSSSVTLQGNSFNAAGRLVRLDGAGALPPVDGSALVNVNSSRLAAVASDTTTIANALAGKLDVGAQAASVANGVYTTGSYSDPSWIKSLSTSKVDLSTVTASLAGKADDASAVHLAGAETLTGVKTFGAGAAFPGGGVWSDSGSVGIGTSTPGVMLDVAGRIRVGDTDPYLVFYSADQTYSLSRAGTTMLLDSSGYTKTASAAGTVIEARNGGVVINTGAGAGVSERLSIASDGNVGVGITGQAQRLSVKDSASITNTAGAQYLLMGNQDSGGTNKPFIMRSANANLDFAYGDSWASATGGVNTPYAQFNGNTGGLVVGNSYINVNNPPANGAILEGPVGVGNAAPDQKLSVAGNISQTGVLISSGTGNNYFAGNVGIGVAGPSYPLQVNGQASAAGYRAAQGVPSAADSSVNGYSFGTDGDTGMFSPGSGAGNGAVAFYSNNLEVMRVTGGSVGIGTAGPAVSAALDVASTSKGLLPPRLTSAQRDAIPSPAAGLVIYNTDNAAIELYNGSAWVGAGTGFAPGAIAAFAAASCPSGWAEYAPARGRFLRGIDNGAGVDPDGTRAPNSLQGDLLRSHNHTITAADVYDPTNAFIINDHSGDQLASSDNVNNGVNSELKPSRYGTDSSGGVETRPANVAVIFCQFSGLGSSAAGGGATLVNGDIWVGNASNSATPVAVSGDATLSNAGVLTLASAGSPGTYRSVTTDAKGRVTSGSNPTTFSGYGLSDTSANLAAAISDETGSGALVFANSPAFSGSVGMGTVSPAARLDVAAAGSGPADMGQVWRNSGGTVVSSVSATGVLMAARFVGDGSGLTGVSGADNLGDHTATRALNMAGNAVDNVSSVTITGAGVAAGAQLLTVGGSVMNVLSDGNVGLGTASPADRLDVAGYTRTYGLRTAAMTTGAELVYIRGTGLNNSAARLVKVGNSTLVNDASGRGLTLTILNAATHALVGSVNYDVYGDPLKSDELAAALNGLTRDRIGILTSFDAIEGAMTDTLRAAARRLGLFKLAALPGGSRRPYAAIFYGSGTGAANTEPGRQAVEVLQSDAAGAPYAVITSWLTEDGFTGQNLANALVSGESDSAEPAVFAGPAGDVGVGTVSPAARLDVQAAGATPADFAQIWRDSSGTIVSSVSAAGVIQAARFIGDGSGLTGLGATGVAGGVLSGNYPSPAFANNAAYPVAAADGNGLKFWDGVDAYKIAMGNAAEYHYGPVSDYSIKTFMDSNGNTRGFTWGGNGLAPVAALNAGNGNFQAAGTITAGGLLRSNANGAPYLCGGDDACLYDINVANAVGINGAADPTVGSLKLGSSGGIISGYNGNIGISTGAPQARLHVVGGGASYADAFIVDTLPNGGGTIILGNDTVNGDQVRIGVNGYLRSQAGNFEMDSTGAPLVYSVNGSEKMRVAAGGNVGIGTAGPNASALLDVASTSKGLLPPRMTTAQRDAIPSPAAGLVVYNTTLAELELYNGTAWVGAGAGFAPGAIAAFAASACPTGWTEYTAARGRFLRGIDNGAGVDPDGTRLPGAVQLDALQQHTHYMTSESGGNDNVVAFPDTNPDSTYASGGNPGARGDAYIFVGNIKSGRMSSETRPNNVAVIYCQFSGLGSGAAGAGAVLPSGDIWVGNASNAATAVAMSGDASLSNSGVLTIANSAVSSAKIADGAIVDADINASAAISGAKISPNFGAQNVVTTGSVGIGTSGPGAKLQVVGGAIMPATGNTAAAGLEWPNNPGGGTGDEAFLRYFAESGESTHLLIGTENDADDRVGLWQFGAERLTVYNGNVGIGTTVPGTKLQVEGPGMFVSPNSGTTGGVIVRDASGDPGAAILQFTNNADSVQYGYIKARSSGLSLSGNVTAPEKTAFSAKACSSVINAGSVIVWETVLTNIGANYNPANGLFTAPVSGMYLFGFNTLEQNAPSGEYRFDFWKNGANFDGIIHQKLANTWETTQGTIAVYMNAGDTMGIYYEQGTGAVYTDCTFNRFWGYLIG